MTVEQFINLKNRIKNDKASVKTNWYDGHKWTDLQGNWYGWTDCGYCEYIFYAGERYICRTLYADGKMQTVMVDEQPKGRPGRFIWPGRKFQKTY